MINKVQVRCTEKIQENWSVVFVRAGGEFSLRVRARVRI